MIATIITNAGRRSGQRRGIGHPMRRRPGPAVRERPMRQQQGAAGAAARGRPWLAAAGVALIVAALGAAGLARRYIVAEAAQFVVFAMAAPALIVLGAPWGLLRLSDAAGTEPGQPGTAPLDRLAAARRQQTSFLRAA